MTWNIVRSNPTFQIGARQDYKVYRSPGGPRGANAQTGIMFSFAGQVAANEFSIPAAMPTAGSFSAANSVADYEAAATNPTSFTIYMKPPGGAFQLFAVATFTNIAALIVFSGTGAYPAGAYFKCVPPPDADPTLLGPVIVLGGP